ncbi:asparaginase [Candidatus Pantoea deserta]|uniref:Asparaginase n=1 Tax=Candidatus Pantoea deserta TaxID=1869313 RepID=A0A3N4NE35_9GAMM|nr:asparaginase [Pantoea deserta]RPD94622.1 asparaginase [Pantoea deserta]
MRDYDNTAMITYRGASVENTHQAHICVTDADGNILFYLGDPHRKTLARSAAKPMQTLAILESGAAEQYAFSDAEIALMCASHSSEQQHLTLAKSLLCRTGLAESDMQCGGHPALSDVVNRAWIKTDYAPTALCNNCSGKHIGMLAGAVSLTGSTDNYHLPEHVMQRRVRDVVSDICKLDETDVAWATDGCNLPAPAFSLDRLAFSYATLASCADKDAHPDPADKRAALYARIFRAMSSYPELVGGEGRFCTELMSICEGQLVGKLGADACYGIALRESDATRKAGAKGAVGIAFKLEDGNIDAMYSVICEALLRLGFLSDKQALALNHFHHPAMVNTMSETTGHREFPFTLRRS